MTEQATGTPDGSPEAQGAAAGAAVVPGTPAPDEVTTLRSRLSGQDAKVTELLKSNAAEKARAEAAEARAAELAQGKDNGDQELRRLLAERDAELATVRKAAAAAQVKADYPETFSVLGEAAASLTSDQLAAAEARFKGVAAGAGAPPPPPRTVGTNPSRGTQAEGAPLTGKARLDALQAQLMAADMSQGGDSHGTPLRGPNTV